MGDEENAEMNAQQKAKPDAQPGGSSKSSLLDTYAPVPDFFYDVKREIEPIGSSSTRVRHLATALYMSTIFVLFGSLLYNYMPAQRISQESIVTSEWQKDGFICKPLQKITIGGLSTDWSYDECVAGVSSPNVDTVIPVEKSDNSFQFDYRFAMQGDSSGVASFHEDRVASSVLQGTSDNWSRDGFSCYPEPPYQNTYNAPFNYTECVEALAPPSTETIVQVSRNTFVYKPFGPDSVCFPEDSSRNLCTLMSCERYFDSGDSYSETCESVYDDNGGGNDLPSAIEVWTQVFDALDDDDFCSYFKENGNGFRCFDKPNPPATKELAIELYASEYPPATICAPLKLNSPFQCTRNVEVPTATILSLSVASAQAVFAVGGLVFVSFLRKLEKPGKNTATSVDDDLRVLVRKLRVGQDELRREFRSRQDELRGGQDELRGGQEELRGDQSRHEELIQNLLKKAGDHQA
jgi:hypothetical protein